MTQITGRKWKRIAIVSIIMSLCLAIGTPFIDNHFTVNIFLAGAFIGFCSGFSILCFEYFAIPRFFRKLPAWIAWFLNSLITFLALGLIIVIAVEIFGMRTDENARFTDMFGRADFQIGLLICFVGIALFRLLTLINTLLGRGVLIKILFGRYHRPHETERVFMFLDMKSSTSIAEKIGHKAFLSLLNEFFLDVSEAILATDGEIYKYVGDEVIVSWPVRRRLSKLDALHCFQLAKSQIRSRSAFYESRFGLIPDFKAGIHAGLAVTGETGYLKKEIAWLGDVLNTTARLESACSKLKTDLLISAQAKQVLSAEHDLVRLGVARLRGKEVRIEVFTLRSMA